MPVTMQGTQESALMAFRKVIASHLSAVLDKPSTILLPLVQQNTGHRKPSHSVFSVVLKRLGDGEDLEQDVRERCLVLSPQTQEYIAHVRVSKDMLLFDPVPLRLIELTIKSVVNDGGDLLSDQTRTLLGKRDRAADQTILVNGLNVQADENAYCSLRRTVLTGFMARLFMGVCHNPVRVSIDHSFSAEGGLDPKIKGLYRGLELLGDSTNTSPPEMETYLKTIRTAMLNSASFTAKVKDGAWTVDLFNQGSAKLFTATEDGRLGEPTLLTKTIALLAYHFAEHKWDRYLWVVPDARRLFAEQAIRMAEMIFFPVDRDELDSVDISSGPMEPRPWPTKITVLLFGAATGGDMWKNNPTLSKGLTGIMEHTCLKMKEIVVKNRGNPGQGTGYDGDDGNDGEEDEELVLDEAELSRMATVLSESALAVASVGCKRIRKLNIDMSRILDGKGNSGVFLQYVHSRLCGIERKSKTKLNPEADLSLVHHYPEALNLCIVLAEWHDVLYTLRDSLDPYVLVPYLFHLAGEIGQANHALRVKGMDPSVAEARWLLFWAAKRVLEEGLTLLGLELAERM
ncbi:hypothetical protein EDD21DRAFT_380334 [Dissophora ornata]|nr:hypothetical protein EDD21DRAFT_380334 [Dissophora ornata]